MSESFKQDVLASKCILLHLTDVCRDAKILAINLLVLKTENHKIRAKDNIKPKILQASKNKTA